jgi:hypothetical protein
MTELIIAVLSSFFVLFLVASYSAIKYVLENPVEIDPPTFNFFGQTIDKSVKEAALQALSIPQPYIAISSPKVGGDTPHKTVQKTIIPPESMRYLATKTNVFIKDYQKAPDRGVIHTKPSNKLDIQLYNSLTQ